MARKDKNSGNKKDKKKSIKDRIKDAVRLSVEPPAKAITPPEKKADKKK